MIPYFSIEFFKIGPLAFYIWGFFLALAFLVGLILSIRAAKRLNIEPQKIIWLIILVYLGAIIGGRLFFILQTPLDFLREPSMIFHVSGGGMMFYGGFSGGLLAGWLYLKKWENCWVLISTLTLIIPLALAIGRLGCFLSNDHLGAVTSLPWAIRWPDGALRHPVALYLILFDLALAGFLWWVSRRHSEKRSDEESCTPARQSLGDGGNVGNAVPHAREILRFAQDDKNSFLLFLTLYSAGRFLLDFTRDISADSHYFGLSTSQWISIILLIFLSLFSINKLTKVSKFDINS
ncbi:MAG: hypothetical protein COV84_02315 [Candidatus Portnoybacteria bacterium CG11_big_fil_rev_8_21_14_0_20_40_15]|uniref:Phosphatidylglycerol--prolipoprotein diacylglyceryl transferase n=1 Tax=Candidatus Portnoybacteria bacterium CG11_big_fil_rev_8_21_14_0_20_40_15 TaxID=1974817 RepID=A0A2H0KSW3_9BACT|nr:MAG: hypothetical protein COV84_02315 [Candidatus Portnoybacteria bacterium CG11_big_fil_rev_8_21_14_0_20_40_15]